MWKTKRICPDCGQEQYVFSSTLKRTTFTGRCHSCSARRQANKINVNRVNPRGRKSSNWKGGKHLNNRGYFFLTVQPENLFFCMADSKNMIREHRFVMAKHLNRPLSSDEYVHHIDGNPSNNQIKNLLLMSKTNHQRFEGLLRYGKVKREDAVNYGI